MSLIIPLIGGAAIALVAAFTGKKKESGSDNVPDGIDEASLFPGEMPDNSKGALIDVTAPTTNTNTNTASSASSTSTKPAGTKLPYANYPKVLFSASKIGGFDANALITKMQSAIQTKNFTALVAAYKQFIALNTDQVRLFHNRYFEKYKVTPYKGWKTIKLSTGQQYIGNLLSKLISAGVGETPKEKI